MESTDTSNFPPPTTSGSGSLPRRISRGTWLIIFIVVLLIAAGGAWILAAQFAKKTSANKTNPAVLAYQKKLPALKSTTEKKPTDAASRVAYAQALYITDDKKAAKNEYIAASKISPKDATIQNNLGNTYRDLGDYSAAVRAYQKSIELDPRNQTAYVNVANVQIHTLKKPAEGIATYKKAMAKIGVTPQFQLLLGLAYEQDDNIAQAKATYQAILKNDPDNKSAKQNLERLK